MLSVERLVERITGSPPTSIFEDQGWYTITLGSEEAQTKLLEVKGKKVAGGHAIKILHTQYKMRPSEIFEWLLNTQKQ